MKYIIIFMLLLVGCSSNPEIVECTPEIVYINNVTNTNTVVEKIIYQNVTKLQKCDCNLTKYNDIYNATLPYILKIKHLDKQLNDFMTANSSCYNKTTDYNYNKCRRELNYTKYMIDKWLDYIE